MRALHDAKGKIEREGVTFHGSGAVTPWAVRRSVGGTVRQLDVVADGRVVRTAGRRVVERLLKKRPGSGQTSIKPPLA